MNNIRAVLITEKHVYN